MLNFRITIVLLLISAQVFASPYENEYAPPASEVVDEPRIKPHHVTHPYPVGEPIADPYPLLLDVPATLERPSVTTPYSDSPPKKTHHHSHYPVPKILVTPSSPESDPRSEVFEKVTFDRLSPFQHVTSGFEQFHNTFSFPNGYLPKFQPAKASLIEAEFEEKTSTPGKYSQDTILGSEAAKLTALFIELKQAIQSLLIDWIGENATGKNAVEVCKLSQSRLMLNSVTNAFVSSIGHFFNLGSVDGGTNSRLEAYRALRTLEDGLAEIRKSIPERAASTLETYWNDLAESITGNLNALTRRVA